MTRTRVAVLLSVVAVAAAVLSFAALRDLALLCGFAPGLAWLLPVVVDAGAAAGSLVWLGRACGPSATTFGRALALSLLATSVAGNAVVHGLAASGSRPSWVLVVVVSAVAPAVLGAVVHLASLVARGGPGTGVRDDTAAPAGVVDASSAVVSPPAPAVAGEESEQDRRRRLNREASAKSRAHKRGDHTGCDPGRDCAGTTRLRSIKRGV